MNTDLIRQFCAVIEAGTIAEASRILNLSPGAVSRALKRLEAELGVGLFVSEGRNIIPNESAHQFYALGKDILKSISSAKLALKGFSAPAKTLKVATFEVFSTHFFARVIAESKSGLSYHLIEKSPGMIEEWVLSGRADMGVTYVPSLNPKLDHIGIGKMRFGVFSNPRGGNQLSLPFAVPTTELGENVTEAVSLDGWPAHFPRLIQYRFEMLETALDLASRGHCKICCPTFLISAENERLKSAFQLSEEELPTGLHLPKPEVYLVKRKSNAESHEFRRIARELRVALKSSA
jgi:DNA-binding transcriptional LysR family regulator